MSAFWKALLLVVSIGVVAGRLVAQDAVDPLPPPEESNCVICHGEPALWEGDTLRLYVPEERLADDIHWQKGLRCHNCHGGNPDSFVPGEAHATEDGFRAMGSPADIPEFCGDCHSDIEYMRRYRPSPRTDQLAEYWTSGHGKRLKETGDANVATCVSCHGHHNIRALDDQESPVYPTRVAETCATCHSDAERMAGREYHGRPLGHNQYENWRQSVHAKALLEDGDLSAPTCNDCHGNHGAMPPEVGSVANACGTCHVKVGALFAETRMKHRFEEVDLPGCAACHNNHDIRSPTDEMLGMEAGAVCAGCHEEGEAQFGATLAGADAARQMRDELEGLKHQIAIAEEKLDEAEILGMEVRAPRFELHQAQDALVNARSLIHAFEIGPMKEALDAGLEVSEQVEQKAEAALAEYTKRRIWLALTLVPILFVIGLLLLYIRSLPNPAAGRQTTDH